MTDEAGGPRVGIIGPPSDPQVSLLARKIEEAGGRPAVLDVPGMPANAPFEIGRGRLVLGGVDLAEIGSAYVRQIGSWWPLPRSEFTADEWPAQRQVYEEYRVEEPWRVALRQVLVWLLARRVPVVNAPERNVLHWTKPAQVWTLARRGHDVPATAAGNDREALAGFLERQGGRALYKPQAGYVYAKVLDAEALGCQEIGFCPLQLQRFVPGENLRVYVVGERAIGAGVLLHDEGPDSRIGQQGVRVAQPPEAVLAAAVAACRALGLEFSAVDFQWDCNRAALLEANTSPMFAGFEEMTGIDVSGALARHLVERALSRKPVLHSSQQGRNLM
ncbi:MAG: hypothetical protein HY720_24990 [Planctomycetes bacterium]|nr:hypothetical protein [Planctomycetota bacterium]